MSRRGNVIRTKKTMEQLAREYHINPNEINFNKLLGSRLRFAREVRGKTQARVGRKIDVTFQQIQKYEKGANEVKVRKLWDLSKYLGFSFKWMFLAFKHREGKYDDQDSQQIK